MNNSLVIRGNICQAINLAEGMGKALYLGLDEKNIKAKFVAGIKVL